MEFNKVVAIAAIAGTLAVGLAGEAGAASGTMFGDPTAAANGGATSNTTTAS
jgi:hypothetical protein